MAPCPLIGSDQPALWHLDAARGPSTPSFDHLVGELLEMRRPLKPERLGGLEIEHQFELGRLHKPALVVGHVGSETTTKISIAGVAVANQPLSCRSLLARQGPEI